MTSTKTNNWRTSTKAWKNESTNELKWLPTMFFYCHWDLILSQKYQSMNYTIPPGKNGMTAWIGFLHPWAWHTRSIGLLLLLRTSAQVEHTGCPHWKIRHSWGTSLQNGHFIWTCDAGWDGSISSFVSASESTSPSWSDSSESDSLSLWIACFGDFKFATRDKKCWIDIVGFGPDIWFHRVSISSSFFLSHALVLYVLTLFSNLAMFRSFVFKSWFRFLTNGPWPLC